MLSPALNFGRNKLGQNKLPEPLIKWMPVIVGLLTLYIPTYYGLSQTLWQQTDQAHGPIVLLVVLYLLWQARASFIHFNASRAKPILGWISLIFGLLCYVVGRSQDIMMLDIGSQIPVLAGLFLLTSGMPALRAAWFPLFFIIFMLPLPLDSITMPMKMAVSYVTEHVLFWFDYPIARSGVILYIGQYQLLVADACAGMHTLISLEALGLLYLNLVKHDSLLRNVTLAILIIPISFTANVVRVIALTLITYYFGDEVGQGFVHGFAGMFLFVIALIFIMSVDSGLQYLVKFRQKNRL
ncbi:MULTISPECIES: exosortase B [Methylotenera]|uniref:exosortase B n=1 Tax=Methylotenera TaxID=359407 RepID=UPI00036F3F28|nr:MULTISPECIES: exosortase B [Methylotenera]